MSPHVLAYGAFDSSNTPGHLSGMLELDTNLMYIKGRVKFGSTIKMMTPASNSTSHHLIYIMYLGHDICGALLNNLYQGMKQWKA